jgi:hypothetical protein
MMRASDAEIQSLCREGVAPHGACPSDGDLSRAAEGSLPRRQRAAVADHLATCARCLRAYRAARSLRSWAEEATGQSAGATRTREWWPYAWAAAAALVAAAVVLPLALRAPPAEVPAEVRGEVDDSVKALIADGASLARDRFVLRWTTSHPGARYRLTLARPDLAPLHEAAGLTSASYRVPASVLASAPAGTPLVWTVEAFLPDGRRLQSRVFRVRLE